MTTPTIFSTRTAVNQGRYNYRHDGRGGLFADQTSIVIPAVTVVATNGALFFVKAGFRLKSLVIKTDDLDTSTNVTLTSGILYDVPSATSVENATLWMASSTIAQTGGEFIWHNTSDPAASNPEYVVVSDGWITVTTGGGSTVTLGSIYVAITGDYGVPTT